MLPSSSSSSSSSAAESTNAPVDPARFLDLCQKYQSGRTLSLGWTGAERYSAGDVDSMLELVRDRGLAGVTFPVQAAPAIASKEQMARLLEGAGVKSTLTLWGERGAKDKDVVEFVQKLGKDKVYVDLPLKT